MHDIQREQSDGKVWTYVREYNTSDRSCDSSPSSLNSSEFNYYTLTTKSMGLTDDLIAAVSENRHYISKLEAVIINCR